MQKGFVLSQLKEEAEKIKKYLHLLENDEHLSATDAEDFLNHIEKIYRNLCVYSHSLKDKELSSDLQVHMKIMQNVSALETNAAAEKIEEPVKEFVEEKIEIEKIEEPVLLRKIELSLNDKFRITNELFSQSQPEFQAALQQLNSINSSNEAIRYLDSLKEIYKWKGENALVKNFYGLVQKRFA